MRAVTETIVAIEAIRIDGRHRRDLGDIAALAESIENSSQLQPVVLGPGNRLIAGERRIAALRMLGRTTVYAVFRENLADAAAALRAERDENVCRKDMTPAELASLGSALEEIERPKAAARQAHGSTAPGRNASVPETPTDESDTGTTAAKVAEALGVSETTYKRIRDVHRAASDPELPEPERVRAQEALSKMDTTGKVKPAYDEWKSGAEITPAQPARATGRRKALPDAIDAAVVELVRIVDRLDRLTKDDRWPLYATKVAPASRHDLRESRDRLAAVVERVPYELPKDGT